MFTGIIPVIVYMPMYMPMPMFMPTPIPVPVPVLREPLDDRIAIGIILAYNRCSKNGYIPYSLWRMQRRIYQATHVMQVSKKFIRTALKHIDINDTMVFTYKTAKRLMDLIRCYHSSKLNF